MHLPCLHAVVPKPAAAAGAAGWNLLPLGPPLQPGGGPFAFGLGPQTLPSAMQPGVNVYSEVPVPPASLLWDAITVGYGWVSDLLVYIGAPWIGAALRRHAATRAQMIRANLIFPSGAILGPIRSPTVYHLDMSEKVLLSYLTGQMIAQRLAKRCWGVNRLLHRSLYGPFIPALTGGALGALGPGQSPDYICFGNLGGGGVGLGLVEAKGTQDNFNPRLVAKNRERINHAFSEQIAPTVGGLGAGGAWNCGVSVACADAALDPDLVVGQFWDPPNPEATRIANEVVEDLTRRYFQSMHFLLTSLGRPVKVQANEQLLWRSREVGFEVRISARQWDWMSDLSEDNLVRGRVVQLAQELPPEKESDVDGVPNGDGLILKLMS